MSTTTQKLSATPLVQKIAAQLGVNLASVTGSGVGGRITRGDVEAAAPPRRPVAAAVPRAAPPAPAAQDDSWFPHIVASERISELTLAGRSVNDLSAEEQRFVREHGHPLR